MEFQIVIPGESSKAGEADITLAVDAMNPYNPQHGNSMEYWFAGVVGASEGVNEYAETFGRPNKLNWGPFMYSKRLTNDHMSLLGAALAVFISTAVVALLISICSRSERRTSVARAETRVLSDRKDVSSVECDISDDEQGSSFTPVQGTHYHNINMMALQQSTSQQTARATAQRISHHIPVVPLARELWGAGAVPHEAAQSSANSYLTHGARAGPHTMPQFTNVQMATPAASQVGDRAMPGAYRTGMPVPAAQQLPKANQQYVASFGGGFLHSTESPMHLQPLLAISYYQLPYLQRQQLFAPPSFQPSTSTEAIRMRTPYSMRLSFGHFERAVFQDFQNVEATGKLAFVQSSQAQPVHPSAAQPVPPSQAQLPEMTKRKLPGTSADELEARSSGGSPPSPSSLMSGRGWKAGANEEQIVKKRKQPAAQKRRRQRGPCGSHSQDATATSQPAGYSESAATSGGQSESLLSGDDQALRASATSSATTEDETMELYRMQSTTEEETESQESRLSRPVSSSSTWKVPAFGTKPKYYKLPQVFATGSLAHLFNWERAKHEDIGDQRIISLYSHVQKLLSGNALVFEDLCIVAKRAEQLAGYLSKSETTPIPTSRLRDAVKRLATRFLLLDVLISCLDLLGTLRGNQWEEFVSRIPTDYTAKITFAGDKHLFTLDLCSRLVRALSTLKAGKRPGDEELHVVKSMLFDCKLSPENIKNTSWNPYFQRKST